MRSYLLVPNAASPTAPQRRVLVSNDASPSAGSLAARLVPTAYSTHPSPECLRGCVIHLLHCFMQRKLETASNASQRPAGRPGLEDLLPS